MSALALRRPLDSVRAASAARRLDSAAIAAPALLGFALCLLGLGARSLWLDESATVAITAQHGAAFGAALARDGGNMLGYYALMHVLVGWFGDGVVLIRLPSALATAATVGFVSAIGLRLWGRRVAALAGVLTAVSLPLVYWGQDARGYALMIALCAGSWLAFVQLTDERSASRGWWMAYVALTTAAAYAGLEAVLIVPAQLLVVIGRRQALGRLLSAALVTGLACLPLAALAAGRGSSQLFWVPPPSLRTAKQVAQALTSSGLQPGYYTPAGDALMIFTGVLLAVGLLGPIRRRARGVEGAIVALAWLVVPIGLELVISLAGHSIFQARYALVALPAVSLLLAWTCTRPRVPGLLGMAAVVSLFALRALALAPSYGASTEQWRTASLYVAAHTRPGDCIAFYPQDARMPFQYYAGQTGRLPAAVLPAAPWSQVRPYVERYGTLTGAQLRGVTAACPRMWLVYSHEGRLGGPAVAGANARRLRGLQAALASEYRPPLRRRFGHASPISVELFRAGR